METLEKITVGAFVAQDFRTASIFSKYGIDFCCKGQRSVEEVCQLKSINEADLLEELNAVMTLKNDYGIDFNSWPIDLLVVYIEKTHHGFVKQKTPIILEYLAKLCSVHGNNHPELIRINQLFMECSGELAQHMNKEELILFPFIKEMMSATKSHDAIETPLFGTVHNPISLMIEEHDAEGERFRAIAALTNNYTAPTDACDTFRVTYAMLEEFEQDLHKHIHLESNILFPKAKALEKFFSNQE